MKAQTKEEKQLSGFDLLSAIFIDRTYNNQEFIMTDALFSDELKYENGVLSATTAFGKTVIASYIISERKVNTLILCR